MPFKDFINEGLKHSAIVTIATYVFFIVSRIYHLAVSSLASGLLTLSMAVFVGFIIGKAFLAVKAAFNK